MLFLLKAMSAPTDWRPVRAQYRFLGPIPDPPEIFGSFILFMPHYSRGLLWCLAIKSDCRCKLERLLLQKWSLLSFHGLSYDRSSFAPAFFATRETRPYLELFTTQAFCQNDTCQA
jgi:hypothetical protein